MQQVLFTRVQYSARVARILKSLPAEQALKQGEIACRARESSGAAWPATAVVGEREYSDELHARLQASGAPQAHQGARDPQTERVQ